MSCIENQGGSDCQWSGINVNITNEIRLILILSKFQIKTVLLLKFLVEIKLFSQNVSKNLMIIIVDLTFFLILYFS